MPSAPGRPRNAGTDQAILDATFELMAEAGVGRLSVRMVAERAGVGKGTIYRRCPSRAALIKDVFMAFASQDLPMPDTGSIREDLVSLLASMIRIYTTTVVGRILPELLAEIVRSPELAEALEELAASRPEIVCDVLAQGVAREELPADIDYQLTSELLIGAIHYRFLISRLPLMPERVEAIVDTVLKGVPRRALVD